MGSVPLVCRCRAYLCSLAVLATVVVVVRVLCCELKGLRQVVLCRLLLVMVRIIDRWGNILAASPSYMPPLGRCECWPQGGPYRVTSCSLWTWVLKLAVYMTVAICLVTFITLATWGCRLVSAKQSWICWWTLWEILMQSGWLSVLWKAQMFGVLGSWLVRRCPP